MVAKTVDEKELQKLVEDIGKTIKLVDGVENEPDFYRLPVYVGWILEDLRKAYKMLKNLVEVESC